jgi:cyanate permease
MCLIVLALIWFAFQKSPPYWRRYSNFSYTMYDFIYLFIPMVYSMMNEVNSADQSVQLWKQKSFIYMLGAYTIIMGAQCAIITLLAQILIPPFKHVIDEEHVGLLGAIMLFVGFPASISVGYYLDRTLKYSEVCIILSVFTALSVLGLYMSTEAGFLIGVVVSW